MRQHNRRDLVLAAARATRAHLDPFADDVANRQRDVTNNQPSSDGERRIQHQAENGSPDTEDKPTHKLRVAVLREFVLGALTAGRTGHDSVDAIVATTDWLLARLAMLSSRHAGVFCSPKLWSGVADV